MAATAFAVLVLAPAASALGVDWEMPNRLSDPIEQSWEDNPGGLPTEEYVNPPDWKVHLYLLNAAGKRICPDYNRHFIWTVTGEGISEAGEHPGRPPSGPGSGSGVNCAPIATVPKQGVYDVSATEYTDQENRAHEPMPTGNVYTNHHVVVRDWLIVGLGDSNASGEGNPNLERGPNWLFAQCDRSERAYQNLVADYVGRTDPRTSVTFVPAGCSGARIGNLFSTSYEGIEPKLGEPLPPQIAQVRAVIGTRRPDAVIMSIGINNLYFSSLLTFCIKQEENPLEKQRCEKESVDIEHSPEGEVSGYSKGSGPTLETATSSALKALPNLYRALAGPIRGLDPGHVFITQYPDIATEEHGMTCGGGSGPLPRFYSSTWQWLDRTGSALNAAVAGTSALGWTPITGIPEAFVGHGYCSSDSWFLPLFKAIDEEDTSGAFHPTFPGQYKSAVFTTRKVCDAFYGNPQCHGLAPAP